MKKEAFEISQEKSPKPLSVEKVGGDIFISISKDKPEMLNHIGDIASAIKDCYSDLDGADFLEINIDSDTGVLNIKNPIIEGNEISDEIFDAIIARVERLNTIF